MFYYIAMALSAFVVSLVGTRLTIISLRKRQMLLDRPNARSNHKNPTPRGGGIAVVFTLIMCLLGFDAGYALIVAMLMLAAISLVDDMLNLPAIIRLAVQIMAISVAMIDLDGLLFHGIVPPLYDRLFSGLIWLWFINLFNFMDGIDGISASEMICIGIGLCLVSAFVGRFPTQVALYGLTLACAGFGFLWWNWHPAKIFLGDVGSIPIGFLIGYLLLLAARDGYPYAAMILPAYYISDSTTTLIRRLWQGKKIWEAHSEHYYQQAVRAGKSHDWVVRLITGVNLLLILLATLSTLDETVAVFNVFVAYALSAFLLMYFSRLHKTKDHAPSL